MGKDLKGRDLGKGFSQRKDGRYEARAVICGEKIDIYDKDLKNAEKNIRSKKSYVTAEFKWNVFHNYFE